MNKGFKSNIDERPELIVTGIFSLYLIIQGFILYLFFLHKIGFKFMILASVVFLLVYLPRFLIINKLKKKDNIKIIDEYLMINDYGIPLSEIEKFIVKENKPRIIFFISNKMIVFQDAEFMIKTATEIKSFKVIGSEKINLLKEFLSNVC
ncbi:MAG: hypothetical protein E7Z87_07810 [Cyanobacteria bacterium SIG26]|nr:hypothetical protein [Cyanobacteria bacterium SIG26]